MKIREHIENDVNICVHDFRDDLKIQKKLVMMGVYEKFAEKFIIDNHKFKIRKPMIFKSFVKFIINRNDFAHQQIKILQKFIR